MTNQRQFTRVPLPFPTRLVCEGETYCSTQGVNVSANGVLVKTVVAQPLGAPCLAQIVLGEGMVITAKGKIVRSDSEATAVHFEQIELDDFELLRNLVRFNAPDPDKVDREFNENLGLCSR